MSAANEFKQMSDDDKQALRELHAEYCKKHGYRKSKDEPGDAEVFSLLKFIPLVTP